VIIFGLVWFLSKKITKPNLKKKKNRIETGSNQPVSVWFGFLGQKPVQTTQFFHFGLVFFSLGSVRFGSFGSRLIKPKPNRTGQFF